MIRWPPTSGISRSPGLRARHTGLDIAQTRHPVRLLRDQPDVRPHDPPALGRSSRVVPPRFDRPDKLRTVFAGSRGDLLVANETLYP